MTGNNQLIIKCLKQTEFKKKSYRTFILKRWFHRKRILCILFRKRENLKTVRVSSEVNTNNSDKRPQIATKMNAK